MYEGCKIEWGILDIENHALLNSPDAPHAPLLFNSTDEAKKARDAAKSWCSRPLGVAYVQTLVRIVMEPETKKVEHVEPTSDGKVAEDTPVWRKPYTLAGP